LRARLLTLLQERFKLVTHRETRELPIYVLSVSKSGPKLEASKAKPEDGPQIRGGGPAGISCKKVTIKMLADMVLSTALGRTVVDNTGLTGEYDFTLNMPPDEPRPPGQIAAASDPVDSSLILAIQEQLGLKMESKRGPVQVVVIDQVERPSVN
jgi:uncharacterized protein (TIGR03435 family)